MSGVVEQAEREEYERDLKSLLLNLVKCEYLKDAAAGVAKQVADKGEGSLAGNQVYVFEKEIRAPYIHLKCGRCEEPILIGQVFDTLHYNGGLCPSCIHDDQKRIE